MSYELEYIAFIIIGYCAGSVFFAKLWGYVFTKRDITLEAPDHNPGTFNAFEIGGFWCGVLTVIGDLLKGILPVALCLYFVDSYAHNEVLMALVMLAPIIGHIFPLYNHFKGGKGIAVTFGVLLGYAPDFKVALLLAIVFLVFSLVLIIRPDYYKTMATFIVAAVISPFVGYRLAIVLAYFAAAIAVCTRLILSDEEKGAFSVSFFKWNIITAGNSADESEISEAEKRKEKEIKP
ncbi:MAG: glycerol-3-phosphate acyltransferase [Lachnospiraceae bacterium]|nr:glycerol-3-phosphate acyltransferase [Lachnospiraceae bacterium]